MIKNGKALVNLFLMWLLILPTSVKAEETHSEGLGYGKHETSNMPREDIKLILEIMRKIKTIQEEINSITGKNSNTEINWDYVLQKEKEIAELRVILIRISRKGEED